MVTHHLHPPRTVPTAPNSTELAEQTAQHMTPIVPNVTKWDTGDPNAMVASHPNQGMHLHLGHSRGSPDAHLGTTHHRQGQKNKTDAIDIREDHSPQDEVALHYIQHNTTVRHTHPEEIMVRDVRAPQCNEAYTTIQLPATASRKGTASLHIKVDTRAGGIVLPSMCFNAYTQIRSAKLAYPLALITSTPDSSRTMDPIYLYMVHSEDPSLGSQIALVLTPTG